MASLLRRFAPMIVTFLVTKLLSDRNGGQAKGRGGRRPRRR